MAILIIADIVATLGILIESWPNNAPALDGGIPSLLYAGRAHPAASEAQR
jgi:hypothetical protein